MPDENKAAGQGENQDAGEKQQTGADQKPATDAGAEDAGAGKSGGGDDKDKAKAPPADTSKKDDEFVDDGTEPPTKARMSSKDFIIQRQQAKIAKLKAKADEGGDAGDTGEGEDEEVAPEDEALIGKVVAKKFAPFLDKAQSTEDDREISEFVAKNPEFKPFEAKVRRYIAHPSRRQLPVESVFYEVAGRGLLKIGADRQKKADEDAKQTQTGGGSGRSGEGGKTAWDMSKEEFEAEQARVRRGA